MKQAILSLFFRGLFVGLLLLVVFGMTSSTTASGPPAVAPLGESACRFLQGAEKGECSGCFDSGGAWTAMGCLGGDSPSAFIASFIKLGTGLGGGIAFLLILFSGFQTMMSAGNPEKLHAAKELMTAAISGLLMIIFSVFLLRLIGVDILALPGFG